VKRLSQGHLAVAGLLFTGWPVVIVGVALTACQPLAQRFQPIVHEIKVHTHRLLRYSLHCIVGIAAQTYT
jgi:hypothetical protein